MIEFNLSQYIIEVNIIRLVMGVFLTFIGLGGKDTGLSEQPNSGTFVFLTGILLVGLSID